MVISGGFLRRKRQCRFSRAIAGGFFMPSALNSGCPLLYMWGEGKSTPSNAYPEGNPAYGTSYPNPNGLYNISLTYLHQGTHTAPQPTSNSFRPFEGSKS